MFNFLINLLKSKLITTLNNKWYYWNYIHYFFIISFVFFIYSLWVLFPTNLFDFCIYFLFSWLGLVLIPLYWIWIWIVFFLSLGGIKIPFLLYPLGIGLAVCRLGILILYLFILLQPVKFVLFYIHKFIQNNILNFLLNLISFFKIIQKQQQKWKKYKKLINIFKKWFYFFWVQWFLNIQKKIPKLVLFIYKKIYIFIKKIYIVEFLFYLLMRVIYYFRVKIYIILFKTNIYIKSKNFYVQLILKNILIIQKTQGKKPEIELILFNKKFKSIAKTFGIKPSLTLLNQGYFLRMEQQKTYSTFYTNENTKYN